jgi:hypothetical protein
MSASFINQNRLYKHIEAILKSKGLLFHDLEKRNDGNKTYYRKINNKKVDRIKPIE